MERINALVDDLDQNEYSYTNWEVILASLLTGGLPLNHLDSITLNKFNFNEGSVEGSVFGFIVALLSNDQNNLILASQDSASKNITFLLYLLSKMNINTENMGS